MMCALQQRCDRKIVIHAVPAPERDCGVVVDMQLLHTVSGDELAPIWLFSRFLGVGIRTVEAPSVTADEPNRSVIECLNNDIALVDLPVVEAAERDEIRGLRFAPPCPVSDMMGIDIALVGAAGESATSIT